MFARHGRNQKGSVRQTLLIILATIGFLTVFAFVSCAALIGYGLSSVGKRTKIPIMSSGNNETEVVFTTPTKGVPYIAGVKFEEEITADFADNIIAKLKYAQADANAVGILLEVNSPGGVVVPSQEVYDTIREISQKKPVVSYVRTMAASGAYYSIVPSTEIVASRGALVGSIGVIMQTYEMDELLKFLKIQPNTLATGALKDAGSPLRPMTLEDKQYLKSLIEQMFNMFLNDVKTVRPAISQKDLSFMSDGRVVLAPQAKDLKLVDLIGSKELAVSELVRLSNQKSTPRIFYYHDLKPFSELFTEKFISGSSKALKDIFVHAQTRM